MTQSTDIDEDGALAGELALRVLSPQDEAVARARAAGDPVFAEQVEEWNERLARMADEIDPVTPSATLWPRIDAAVAPPAANDNGKVFWRRWAMGSTGLLVASLAAVVTLATQNARAPIAPPVAPPAEAQIVKVATLMLQDGENKPAMTLVYDPNTENLYLSPTDVMAGDTRVPHLWLVNAEGGVQLVGAVDGSAASRMQMASLLKDQAGSANAVAISMEAPGHTPAANKPDGPVVAAGELQRL